MCVAGDYWMRGRGAVGGEELADWTGGNRFFAGQRQRIVSSKKSGQ